MNCQVHSSTPSILSKFTKTKPSQRIEIHVFSCHNSIYTTIRATQTDQLRQKTDVYSIDFKTMRACKLGISRYPDFEYNAQGGRGTGIGTKMTEGDSGEMNGDISVCFDINTLYIPPLTSETTKFLGLPLPPFLKIDIFPKLFQGSIDPESGKVDLQFTAKFLFSAGSIYRAPPLVVTTVLTSEETKGESRSGKGKRLDKEGNCRLVGIAKVDPIDDFFMNTFLSLPTECLAKLNVVISLYQSD